MDVVCYHAGAEARQQPSQPFSLGCTYSCSYNRCGLMAEVVLR
jgi:hypothetical protein